MILGRTRGAAIGMVAAGTLAACATTTAPVPGGSTIEPDAPFAVLETLPAGAAIASGDLHPFIDEPRADGPRRFLVVAADGAGLTVGSELLQTATRTDRFGAAVAVADGAARTEFLIRDDDGTVRLPAVIDEAKQALTRFAPPLVVAPPTLVAGVELRSEVAMRVLDAQRPQRVRESGRATRTIEYVADERIRTPRGEMVAHRLEIRFEADLRLAHVTTTIVQWVSPDHGLVASERIEDVRVLGFPADRSLLRLVWR